MTRIDTCYVKNNTQNKQHKRKLAIKTNQNITLNKRQLLSIKEIKCIKNLKELYKMYMHYLATFDNKEYINYIYLWEEMKSEKKNMPLKEKETKL